MKESKNNLDKIIKIALKAKYPEINVDALIAVIQATPNPVMATEIILGDHDPVILEPLRRPKASHHVGPYILTEVDEWNDKVFYKYQYHDTSVRYYKTQEERDLATPNNHGDCKYSSTDEYKFRKEFDEGIKGLKNDMSIESWKEGMFAQSAESVAEEMPDVVTSVF
jgi:hypothetical protein